MKKLILLFLIFGFSFSVQANAEYPLSFFDLKDLPIELSEAYPNPARDEINFDYQLNSNVGEVKIVMHNVLGNIVGEYELNAFDSHLTIRTDGMQSGIYFYTVSVDGQNALTRKIIIRH
ncbi:MAG: T9SS type A sorting domain-containing protein [Bacteroidota bacterium]